MRQLTSQDCNGNYFQDCWTKTWIYLHRLWIDKSLFTDGFSPALKCILGGKKDIKTTSTIQHLGEILQSAIVCHVTDKRNKPHKH